MVERLLAAARGFERDCELLLDALLADELVQVARSERALEHDPLGGLLADSRDRLEARRVLERDRAAQLVRRGARDDRQRDLRADPLDGEQQLEELALGSLGKAEQLQDVLPHMKIRLEHDLSPGLRLPPRAVRGVDEVADAADIQNDAGRRARDDLPAKPRDHEVRLGARPDGPPREYVCSG